jgi:hypothetical protein
MGNDMILSVGTFSLSATIRTGDPVLKSWKERKRILQRVSGTLIAGRSPIIQQSLRNVVKR